jgi:hypothetical protein
MSLRSQCFNPETDETIQTGQLCFADGVPARFGSWGRGDETFTAYLHGTQRVELPWTKLQRFLSDEDLKKFA